MQQNKSAVVIFPLIYKNLPCNKIPKYYVIMDFPETINAEFFTVKDTQNGGNNNNKKIQMANLLSFTCPVPKAGIIN